MKKFIENCCANVQKHGVFSSDVVDLYREVSFFLRLVTECLSKNMLSDGMNESSILEDVPHEIFLLAHFWPKYGLL